MKRQFRKLSHSVYECKYHGVFCPKYRHRVLTDEVAEHVRQRIYQLCRQKDQVEVLNLSIQPDHVHLVVSVPPKYAISDLMGSLKGKLALSLFRRYERFGRRNWGRHVWSRGYCVSPIGLDEARVRRYVQWQERKKREDEAMQQRLF